MRLLLERSQQRGGSTRPPNTRESQTESSESETETESESGSESYDKEDQPAAVDTVTVLPRKGAQGRAKERVKGGQSGGKVPAGAVRVLPEDGGRRRKGTDRQGGEKDKGGGGEEIAGEEESSWDR